MLEAFEFGMRPPAFPSYRPYEPEAIGTYALEGSGKVEIGIGKWEGGMTRAEGRGQKKSHTYFATENLVLWPRSEKIGYALNQCHGTMEYWNAGILGLVQ